MKRLLLVLLLVGCTGDDDDSAPADDDDAVPETCFQMFRSTPERQGHTPHTLPREQPRQAWAVNVSNLPLGGAGSPRGTRSPTSPSPTTARCSWARGP